MNLYFYADSVEKLRKPIDKRSWKTHGKVAVVNAWYSPFENSINIPAGILDGAFFSPDRPLYLNYGGIGSVIGHEITHGFDDEGSQRDGQGNLVDWWESEAKSEFLKRSQCVIDQYGNYTVEVNGEILNLNGVNTQGENIADIGGFKEAYRAYDKYVKVHGSENLLPAVKYSQSQLFWLSLAQVWCGVQKPQYSKFEVLLDRHSPLMYRVIGPLGNNPDFARDWNCPVGSMMNPVKKCTVW